MGQWMGWHYMFPISSWTLDERLTSQERSEKTDSEIQEVEPARGRGSYVLQRVGCGKASCHCVKPGRELHGPYWYLYIKKDGRTRSKYIGRASRKFLYAMIRQMQQIRTPFFESLTILCYWFGCHKLP